MVLMKAARKRAAGAGNSAPKKRQGFPDVSQGDLEEAIDNHIRVIGVREGMNFLSTPIYYHSKQKMLGQFSNRTP